MKPTTPLKVETTTLDSDPTKTVTTLSGGEVEVQENKGLEVNAVTSSVEGDPTRTQTVLNAPVNEAESSEETDTASESKLVLTIEGPFSGTVEFEGEQTLKELLSQIKSDAGSFGNFKYKDSEGKPVGVTHVVSESTTITSVPR